MTLKAMVVALAMAVGLAVSWQADLDAQRRGGGYGRGFAVNDPRHPDKRSGPLWWMPENDASWSRHHDVWRDSPAEVAAPGAWTSFSLETWAKTQYAGGYDTAAPTNTACDYVNGRAVHNVGPPLRNSDYRVPARNRASRKPDDASGGYGGLQMSLHIGEWWRVINDNYFGRRIASQFLLPSGCRCLTIPATQGKGDLDRQGRARRRPCPSHTSVRLCSPPSRRIATLCPRSAGLTALTAAPRRRAPVPGRTGAQNALHVGQLAAPGRRPSVRSS